MRFCYFVLPQSGKIEQNEQTILEAPYSSTNYLPNLKILFWNNYIIYIGRRFIRARWATFNCVRCYYTLSKVLCVSFFLAI